MRERGSFIPRREQVAALVFEKDSAHQRLQRKGWRSLDESLAETFKAGLDTGSLDSNKGDCEVL